MTHCKLSQEEVIKSYDHPNGEITPIAEVKIVS